MQETPQGNWLGRIINKIVGSSEQTLPVDKRAAISHNVDTAWRKAAPPLFKADNLGELLAASPILFVPTAALVRPEEIKTDNLNKAIKFDSNLGNGPLENLPVNPEQPVNPEPTPIGTAVATEVAQLYSGPGQSYNVEGQTQINQQLTYVGRANINGEAWALTDQGQWARVDSLNLNQQELENVTDLSVFNSTPEVDLAGDGSGYENLSGSLFDQDIDLVHVKHQLDGMVESGFPQELLNHLGLLDASDQSTALVIKEDFSVTSGETTITYERGTLIDIPNNPNETTITFVSPANIRSALSEQYGLDLGQDQLLFSKSSSEDPSWRQIVKLNSNMVMLFDVGGSREDNAAGKPINEILANNVIVINGDFASEDFAINYDNNTITLADGTVLTITQNEGEVARAEVAQAQENWDGVGISYPERAFDHFNPGLYHSDQEGRVWVVGNISSDVYQSGGGDQSNLYLDIDIGGSILKIVVGENWRIGVSMLEWNVDHTNLEMRGSQNEETGIYTIQQFRDYVRTHQGAPLVIDYTPDYQDAAFVASFRSNEACDAVCKDMVDRFIATNTGAVLNAIASAPTRGEYQGSLPANEVVGVGKFYIPRPNTP